MTARCVNDACRTPGRMPIADGLLLCSDCFAMESARHRPAWGGQNAKYPFAEMAVGDMRIIDRPRANVAPAASQYGMRHGKQFRVYRHDDDGKCLLTRTK